ASRIEPFVPWRFPLLPSLQRLLIDERFPLVIVERLLLMRQLGDGSGAKPALEEPMRRPRRQHEQLGEPQLARSLLDFLHQRFAITFALEVGMNRQRGELAHPLFWKRVERGAADDVIVVLRADE